MQHNKEDTVKTAIHKILPLVHNGFISTTSGGDNIHASWVLERWVGEGQSPIVSSRRSVGES
jgi:hypothetical protein